MTIPELKPEQWPLVVICVAMIVAAIIDGWKLKVPNWLTLPLIVCGWMLGIYYWITGEPVGTEPGNRLVASLVGTFVGFILLYWLHALGGMGAGDVKMQMGFGAWVAAYYGLREGVQIVFFAWITAVLIGGVLGLLLILWKRQFRQNIENTRSILSDFVSGSNVKTISDRAAQRKSRLQLLPYGIPLCLGFVSYLYYLLLRS